MGVYFLVVLYYNLLSTKEREMSDSAARGGIGFTGLLQIVFIVLKLVKQIDWSWWWVLSPIWISVVLFMLFVIIIIWLSD